MIKRILLYGATGYSGRLIAAEARRCIDSGALADHEVVLGGRNRFELARLSLECGLIHAVFALDDRSKVESVLSDFDVVLNAAGPFSDNGIGIRLAKAAIAAQCHYVDINGEVSVYKALDDLGRLAEDRGVRLVSGAGFTATVSDVMLRWAVTLLQPAFPRGLKLGAVRIAASDMTHLSRGSVLTMMRSIREEVTLVRDGAYVHVPVGRLEQSFDFGSEAGPRIASAANLLDTCTAFETTRDLHVDVGSIESYIEMPLPFRVGYQLGAISAAWLYLPFVQRLTKMQIDQLPDGPDSEERKDSRQSIVLQIESPYREPWVDWRMETPSSYDVTARTALTVAAAVTGDASGRASGWFTPSRVLALDSPSRSLQFKEPVSLSPPLKTRTPVSLSASLFQGCTLEGRPVMAPVS
jgi:short subunit dehydrogenase-like uncharacterized protein